MWRVSILQFTQCQSASVIQVHRKTWKLGRAPFLLDMSSWYGWWQAWVRHFTCSSLKILGNGQCFQDNREGSYLPICPGSYLTICPIPSQCSLYLFFKFIHLILNWKLEHNIWLHLQEACLVASFRYNERWKIYPQ